MLKTDYLAIHSTLEYPLNDKPSPASNSHLQNAANAISTPPSKPAPPPQSYLSGKDFTTFYKSPAREIIKASGAQQH